MKRVQSIFNFRSSGHLVIRSSILQSIFLVFLLWSSAYADGAASVYIEDLTWMEVRERVQSGRTIAIIPSGGTQQEGPQLATGKHNVVAAYAASEIARRLGNALVAPVIAYVPSGRISPPEGHMQFPGTISVSNATYEALLEEAARSLKQSGFHMICFLGDSVGTQAIQARVARRLNEEWRSDRVTALNLSSYFYKNGHEEWSETLPVKVEHPEAHAGHIDTSEMMAVDSAGVRDNLRGVRGEHDYKTTGAMGDSSVASAAYGRKYLSLKIEAAIRQIQNASGHAK